MAGFKDPACHCSANSYSDFEYIFYSFIKGEVSSDILNNCLLMYKCKTCLEVQLNFSHFVEHSKKCKPLQNKINVNNNNTEIAVRGHPIEKNGDRILNNANNYTIVLSKEDEKSMDLKKMICLVCKFKFHTTFHLRQHFATMHLGFRRYKCKLCDFKSSYVNSCLSHSLKKHNLESTKRRIHQHFWSLNCRTANIRRFWKPRKCQFRHDNKMVNGPAAETPNVDETRGTETLNGNSSSNNGRIDKETLTDNCNGAKEIPDKSTPDMEDDPINSAEDICYSAYLNEDENGMMDLEKVTCLKCKMPFADSDRLKQHLALIHLGHNRFRCKLCERFECRLKFDCDKHALSAHNRNTRVRNVFCQVFGEIIYRTRNYSVR